MKNILPSMFERVLKIHPWSIPLDRIPPNLILTQSLTRPRWEFTGGDFLDTVWKIP